MIVASQTGQSIGLELIMPLWESAGHRALLNAAFFCMDIRRQMTVPLPHLLHTSKWLG